jgi:uncharacterized protein YdhG (YjbR/CyaY superfamily)
MVQSAAASVDAFLEGVEPARLEAVKRLREACRDAFPGWEERMQWGMPGYGPPGSDNLVSFNNQKNYVSLYAGRDAIERYKDAFKGASFGGGCVRFAKPERIDFELVEKLLDHAYQVKSASLKSC